MSRQASVVEVDKTLVVAQRRCKDLGVTVKFDRYAETACTNGKNITLPYVSQPCTKNKLDEMYGFIIHECGHHLRPEAFAILKGAKPPAHLCALYNIVEDDGMERERALEWKGDAIGLSTMNSLLMQELEETWNKEGPMPDQPDPAPVASMTIGQLSRLVWDKDNAANMERFIKQLPKGVQDLVTELDNEGWVRRYRDTTSAKETWNTACDLAKRLYPNNDQAEYEKIREAGNKAAEGGKGVRDDSKSSFKDSQGGSDNSKTVDVSADPNKSSESDTGDVQEGGDGCNISWKDCVLSEHNEWSGGDAGSMGITWEDRKQSGGVAILPSNRVTLVDWKNDRSVTSRAGRLTVEDFLPKEAHSRAFANKIRRYIQSLARSTVDREKYTGKLDKQAVVRLLLPPIDGGEWNKKIFYDQRKHTVKDTCIFVLVDWSGSMRGPKMRQAADAAQRLVHTFDRVLKIPVALAAFSDRNTQCDIGYIKPWNTRGMPAQTIAERFHLMCNYTSGNDDADAVNWAYQQIVNRKESRKMLIVLSDGAPAGSLSGHPDDALKHVTTSIEKDGRVELYGVGIQSHAVKKYYTNHIHLKDEHLINETLFTLIKEGNNVRK